MTTSTTSRTTAIVPAAYPNVGSAWLRAQACCGTPAAPQQTSSRPAAERHPEDPGRVTEEPGGSASTSSAAPDHPRGGAGERGPGGTERRNRGRDRHAPHAEHLLQRLQERQVAALALEPERGSRGPSAALNWRVASSHTTSGHANSFAATASPTSIPAAAARSRNRHASATSNTSAIISFPKKRPRTTTGDATAWSDSGSRGHRARNRREHAPGGGKNQSHDATTAGRSASGIETGTMTSRQTAGSRRRRRPASARDTLALPR